MMNKWEIWMASFAYDDDPTKAKDRAVLVIDDNITFPILVAKVTTHKPRNNYQGEYQIIKWKEAGLNLPSTIRLSKQLLLEKINFRKKKGRLHPIDIIAVQKLISDMKQ